jgi:hypothetical protein
MNTYEQTQELLNNIEARQQMLEEMLKELITISWKSNEEIKSQIRTRELESRTNDDSFKIVHAI